jgi:aminobenzoyl-glutamate utilization protein A
VAFRFEMDALPIRESEDEQHRPKSLGFTSTHPGVMHACGHDGHVALGLGLAALLSRLKGRLPGRVRLLFQPAEEGCRGAQAMVDAGALDDVDYLLGLHLGVKALSTGVLYAGVNGLLATHKFDAYFRGKSAHAGINPEAGRNALLAAASAALAIHAVPNPGRGPMRVNVGYLKAGEGRNVVPSYAMIKAESRALETPTEEYAYHQSLRCIETAARSYGVEYEIVNMGWAPGANSNPEVVQIVEAAAGDVPHIHERFDVLNDYGGSDDFTIMMQTVQEAGGKACFTCLGSNLVGGHHQNNFDFDEASLTIGLTLLAHVIKYIGLGPQLHSPAKG